VVGYVRVVSGTMEASRPIMLMRNNARYEIKEVGVFTRRCACRKKLNAGDVGYFIANIKSTADIKIGDTIMTNGILHAPRFSAFRKFIPWSSADLSDQHR